ncbi:hypothetical protein RCJ22_37470, partial [Vibrio sp. FNV 38]|nr:hypothetical protein [Vibrio sp. FNV 38]
DICSGTSSIPHKTMSKSLITDDINLPSNSKNSFQIIGIEENFGCLVTVVARKKSTSKECIKTACSIAEKFKHYQLSDGFIPDWIKVKIQAYIEPLQITKSLEKFELDVSTKNTLAMEKFIPPLAEVCLESWEEETGERKWSLSNMSCLRFNDSLDFSPTEINPDCEEHIAYLCNEAAHQLRTSSDLYLSKVQIEYLALKEKQRIRLWRESTLHKY